jgi:hypothetical protein
LSCFQVFHFSERKEKQILKQKMMEGFTSPRILHL